MWRRCADGGEDGFTPTWHAPCSRVRMNRRRSAACALCVCCLAACDGPPPDADDAPPAEILCGRVGCEDNLVATFPALFPAALDALPHVIRAEVCFDDAPCFSGTIERGPIDVGAVCTELAADVAVCCVRAPPFDGVCNVVPTGDVWVSKRPGVWVDLRRRPRDLLRDRRRCADGASALSRIDRTRRLEHALRSSAIRRHSCCSSGHGSSATYGVVGCGGGLHRGLSRRARVRGLAALLGSAGQVLPSARRSPRRWSFTRTDPSVRRRAFRAPRPSRRQPKNSRGRGARELSFGVIR